ncbi:MAG: YlzJ-like family protein [Dethiobacter sp.]|jgi:hypothetical protein|nr:YlzJ-like family protein [Dethiobacter sp.]MBS3900682.1 YlzJ-like family protein [Dethiobacter sp.]MBS3989276.1 YlzJ-like family protein [Dethiobacter sp.]
MLWTIVPLNIVMDGSDLHQPTYTEIPWKSGILLVEETGQNTARVVRLLSTDPADYLEPATQPGKILEYSKKKPV